MSIKKMPVNPFFQFADSPTGNGMLGNKKNIYNNNKINIFGGVYDFLIALSSLPVIWY